MEYLSATRPEEKSKKKTALKRWEVECITLIQPYPPPPPPPKYVSYTHASTES